ncbi:MAG: methyltransferase domain-containing protein [Deltaproteobacteria bacterium]|nr:methyltransferase domain-containing protein [Deltaproteobacteria bacterium]
MKRIPWILSFLIGACAASPASPVSPVSPAPGMSTATAAAPAAIPVDPALRAALAGSLRTEAERARDGARHPAETLTFFGLRPDQRVVELWPGAGFYTAILAPYLADHGALAVTVFDPAGDPAAENTQEARATLARLGSSPLFAKVVAQRIAVPELTLGADGSADLVLTFRNVHNWIPADIAPDVFRAVARVLKPGGVLGVVDHRAAHDLTAEEVGKTGYVSEAQVIALAEAAGLVLEARAEINANPRDTKDHPNGVWSLPPTYAGKDVDRARFAAIGESDRMTLRFRKP